MTPSSVDAVWASACRQMTLSVISLEVTDGITASNHLSLGERIRSAHSVQTFSMSHPGIAVMVSRATNHQRGLHLIRL